MDALVTISQLKTRFLDLKVDESGDLPALVVLPTQLIEVVTLLKSDEYQFTFLTDLCGIHYPDVNPPLLGVVYHLHNLGSNIRLRIKCFVSVALPVVPSLTPLFSSADWMERETYDFFGIQFEGHPNLVRILNMDEMAEFPMRKEFTLEDPSRTDKKDEYFGR